MTDNRTFDQARVEAIAWAVTYDRGKSRELFHSGNEAKRYGLALNENGWMDVAVVPLFPTTARIAELEADCRNYVTQLGESGLQVEILKAKYAELEALLGEAEKVLLNARADMKGWAYLSPANQQTAIGLVSQLLDRIVLLDRIGSEGGGTEGGR